jgi:hypothetical protein
MESSHERFKIIEKFVSDSLRPESPYVFQIGESFFQVKDTLNINNTMGFRLKSKTKTLCRYPTYEYYGDPNELIKKCINELLNKDNGGTDE